MSLPWPGSFVFRALALIFALAAFAPLASTSAAPMPGVAASVEPAFAAPGDTVEVTVEVSELRMARGSVAIYGFIENPGGRTIGVLSWRAIPRGDIEVKADFLIPVSAPDGEYALNVLVRGDGVWAGEDAAASFTISAPNPEPEPTPTEPPATPTETSPDPTATPQAGDPVLDQAEAEFLSLLNAYRVENGLGLLARNATLDLAAQRHSEDMAARAYFSHDTPEGVTPWDRMQAAGYACPSYKGENIAAGYDAAQRVFEAWRNSPGHNANMLSPYFDEIGIGLAYDADSPFHYYWTTDFGRCVG